MFLRLSTDYTSKLSIKPLICSPSPRDISDFEESLEKLPADKLLAKYMHEKEAYENLREWFLHSTYDYMVIVPDDLIVSPEAFDVLLQDLQTTEFPVLSGICNLNYDTPHIYTPKRFNEKDYWIHSEFVLNAYLAVQPLQHVRRCGFACTFIRRDIVAKIPLIGDDSYGLPTGFDRQFENDCEEHDIPIFVDLRAIGKHLSGRMPDKTLEKFMLNLKPPEIRFIKYE